MGIVVVEKAGCEDGVGRPKHDRTASRRCVRVQGWEEYEYLDPDEYPNPNTVQVY